MGTDQINEHSNRYDAPANAEPEQNAKNRTFDWKKIDAAVKWLPAAAAVYGFVKWIVEIVRCFTGGAYRAQCTNCTRLFSVEFFSRYFSPVFLWLTGAAFFLCLAYGFVRFYRLSAKGKKITVTILLAVATVIAVPVLFKLLFVPNAYKDNFPVFMLNLSGLAVLIALGIAYFDKTVQNGFLLKSVLLWALTVYLGIPLVILLTQNAVTGVITVLLLIFLSVMVLYTKKNPPEPKYTEIPENGSGQSEMTTEQQAYVHKYNEAMRALNCGNNPAAIEILEELGEHDFILDIRYDELNAELEGTRRSRKLWSDFLEYGDNYIKTRKEEGCPVRYGENYIRLLVELKEMVDGYDAFWESRKPRLEWYDVEGHIDKLVEDLTPLSRSERKDKETRFRIRTDLCDGISSLIGRVRNGDPNSNRLLEYYLEHGNRYEFGYDGRLERLVTELHNASQLRDDYKAISYMSLHLLEF